MWQALNIVPHAQNAWDRSRPLIVHAAASTTYPTSHYTVYKDIVYPYWSENPAKFRFNFGPYQRSVPPSFSRIKSSLTCIKIWLYLTSLSPSTAVWGQGLTDC